MLGRTPKDIIALGQKYLSPGFARAFQIYDEPFALVEGNMQYVWGGLAGQPVRQYLDLMAHNLTISLGHHHPAVRAAIRKQKLNHCTAMYMHPEGVLFAKELIETLPPHPSGEDWVLHPTNSGAEAVDLVYQITALNAPPNGRLLTLNHSFHGLQGLALHATDIGELSHRSPYMLQIDHIEANPIEFDRYRHLQQSIRSTIACFMAESIRGFGGVIPHPPGFLKYTFDHVTKMGGLTFVDEIQTLFRTGRMWAFEDHDVIPDGIIFGKGIANGLPLSGLICRRSLTEKFAQKKFFNTFAGGPIPCAAGRATLKAVQNEDLIQHSVEMGGLFRHGFQTLCERYPMLFQQIRGSAGLYQGLVINGVTPALAKQHARHLQIQLRDNYGVIIGRGGTNADVFRIQPPMCIHPGNVRWVVDSLEEAGRVYINEQHL